MLSFYEQIYTIEKDNKINNSKRGNTDNQKITSESDFFDKQQTIDINKDLINLNEKDTDAKYLTLDKEKNNRYSHISKRLLKKNNQALKNKVKTCESLNGISKKMNEEDKADDKSILYEDFCLVIKENDSEKLEISKKKKASLNFF